LNISFEEMMPESTPDQTILDPPALFIKQGIMQPFGFDIGNFHCIMLDPPHHPGSQSPPGLLIFLIGNPYKPFV